MGKAFSVYFKNCGLTSGISWLKIFIIPNILINSIEGTDLEV
jgi:hypothetical protein